MHCGTLIAWLLNTNISISYFSALFIFWHGCPLKAVEGNIGQPAVLSWPCKGVSAILWFPPGKNWRRRRRRGTRTETNKECKHFRLFVCFLCSHYYFLLKEWFIMVFYHILSGSQLLNHVWAANQTSGFSEKGILCIESFAPIQF